MDDPRKPEFDSFESYRGFVRRVMRGRRYVWEKEVHAFLDTVLATVGDRKKKIEKGGVLYRAQRGVDEVLSGEGFDISSPYNGYSKARMKPQASGCRQGRVNPDGISVLYLSTLESTAISEVRPWIGSRVSIAEFRIARDLNVIDLTRYHGKTPIIHLSWKQLDDLQKPEVKEKAVWMDIDSAFSRPITLSDEEVGYVPTQILTELFRSVDYQGVYYKSQFGHEGFNLALFDVDDAHPIRCAPFEVNKIEVAYEQIGNWK